MPYEQIWAPWRLAYITNPHFDGTSPDRSTGFLPGADKTCFLCQSVADPDSRARQVIQRTPQVVTLLNRYPYNNGHLLVAPNRHRGRLDELTPEERAGLMQAITQMVGLLEKVLQPEGFNIGLNLGSAGGAGLPGHLHWHIVPRWSGDTNFMLSVAAVRVIPQALEELWQALTDTLCQES